MAINNIHNTYYGWHVEQVLYDKISYFKLESRDNVEKVGLGHSQPLPLLACTATYHYIK